MEEVIEKIEDTSGLYYEEPTDQASLARLDWASTPLYKHYLGAYQEDKDLIKFLQEKYKGIYSRTELEYNIMFLQLPEQQQLSQIE